MALSFGQWLSRDSLLALGAGAVTVLGFAPFGLAPIPFITLTLLFHLWRDAIPTQAFRLGYLFGLGLLGVGVSWVRLSIEQFTNGGPVLAWLMAGALVAFMALFYGLAGWTGARVSRAAGPRLLLAFPGAWLLTEWARGWFLTGFPWLWIGYSQVDSPLAGYAPVLGVLGVGGALALSAGLAAWMLRRDCGRHLVALIPLLVLWLAGQGLRQVDWVQGAGEPFRVSLVQGNVTPDLKWSRDQLQPTLDLYLSATRANWDSRLVVWPETAVPAFAHQVRSSLLEPLWREARAQGTDLLVGIPVADRSDGRYYNAMLALGEEQRGYSKRHLVPFGEFTPLPMLVQPIADALAIPLSNFSTGGMARPLLPLAGYSAAISICYEDAFGEETRQALPEAAFLVNASNDAWFGDSLAPHQHLEIARMRALETGRYMLRATNTGITALIDEKGRVRDRAAMFEQAVLSGQVVPMKGATPYVRVGSLAAVLIALGTLIAAFAAGRAPGR
jgi:apolipoprotein N-acyltransferase